MFKGNDDMKTSITLKAEQIGLLLQILHTEILSGNIDSSDQVLADEVLDILESAENAVYSNS